MKNTKRFLIIAVSAILLFGVTACKDDPEDNDDSDTNALSVTDLPEFPSGSTPAATQAAAEQILKKMRDADAIGSILEEIWDFFDNFTDENYPNYWDEEEQISFSDITIPGKNLKLSAALGFGKSTGGFKAYYDANYNEIDNIQFAVGDKDTYFDGEDFKAEVTADKTIDGVTVVKGSTFAVFRGEYGELTVITAGTTKNMRVKGSECGKEQFVYGCTVAAGGGSIKIIYDTVVDYGYSTTNGSWGDWNSKDGWTELEEKASGSLKIYGANNALLINKTVTNYDDFEELDEMIYF